MEEASAAVALVDHGATLYQPLLRRTALRLEARSVALLLAALQAQPEVSLLAALQVQPVLQAQPEASLLGAQQVQSGA